MADVDLIFVVHETSPYTFCTHVNRYFYYKSYNDALTHFNDLYVSYTKNMTEKEKKEMFELNDWNLKYLNKNTNNDKIKNENENENDSDSDDYLYEPYDYEYLKQIRVEYHTSMRHNIDIFNDVSIELMIGRIE